MYVYNSLEGTHYTSIDDLQGDTSFRDRTQYIFDLGNQGVWGDCKVYEYSFTGAGSSTHPANTVQKVVIGDLSVGTTEEIYSLIVKKVDATNPTKGLSGAKFHIEATNGSYEDIPLIAEIACQHDIGKRDLPDSIVYKASPLTQTEAAVMQLHTVLGAYVVVRA